MIDIRGIAPEARRYKARVRAADMVDKFRQGLEARAEQIVIIGKTGVTGDFANKLFLS
jgi:hypothetical protein